MPSWQGPNKPLVLPDPDPRRRGTPRPPRPLPPDPLPPPPPPLPSGPGLNDDLPEVLTAFRAAQVRAVLAERARRQVEALRLYEPLPVQHSFHQSRCPVRLLRGSNRGGKTLPAAVEVARAVTGQDPHGKYPTEDGRWFAVGKDLNHIGQVMWRKLGRAGAFKIIREPGGRWRAFRPWDPADLVREGEARPAPPLIPPRFIKEIAWENKRLGIPSVVRLHNGWELSFFSSLGKPPQGSDIDGWWFDEEIVDADWFPEMSARVLDRRGVGIWSATPQAGTEQLYELHERADAERGLPAPGVDESVLLLAENPHFADDVKRTFAANLSPEEYRVRIGGEFAISSFKVYPEFSMLVHGVDWFAIPPEWARYLVVDPGHQVCAVLFGAVPPASAGKGDAVYLYDELYLRECDAAKFAHALAHKAAGQVFQRFWIDSHMAVHTELGTGLTVGQQYSAALRSQGVASIDTGSNFQLACDDVQAGLLAVHGWLRLGADGSPKLRVLSGALPNFEYEIKRYHKLRQHGQITDRPDQRKNNHLMDCLRYLALADPKYVKPDRKKTPAGGAIRALKQKRDRQREVRGPGFVRLGPGRGGRGW